MKRYFVIGPRVERVDRILDDGSGPVEISYDVVEVEASNPREARRLGFHQMQANGCQWIRDARLDRRNPFVLLSVEEANND